MTKPYLHLVTNAYSLRNKIDKLVIIKDLNPDEPDKIIVIISRHSKLLVYLDEVMYLRYIDNDGVKLLIKDGEIMNV